MLVDLQQNTLKMPTPPTLSTPQHSCAPSKPPKVSHLSPLPSTISPVPAFILPLPCLEAEQVLPHNIDTAMRDNSSTSPLAPSSNTAMFDRSTLVSTLPSPGTSLTEICHCTHTVGHDNNGTSICDSDKKLKCTRKRSSSGKSPRPVHHIFPLCSPLENIPILRLPPSVPDAYYDNSKPQTRHSALSSSTTSTHINDVPSLIPPSSLPSIGDDISALCLPFTVWKE